ncbi:MAG: hypothetical protein F6J93_15965 [Oscillatoria sp. SIO1A7]|nr:hypothetical protein [Oscillatoria sp. SIO1A7]
MNRLNRRAFKILRREINNCATKDPIGETERQIAMKRLKLLREDKGPPASLEELRETFATIYPQFSEQALKRAANANRPPGLFTHIKWATLSLAGIAGAIWVANLPHPLIRRPIASKAPILLLPTTMQMDYNYRQAISLVEQADQLVNKASGPADLDLGQKKVRQAQKHLDKLPAWFLDYYPQGYCRYVGCSWRFTYDEFQSARKATGRMEAKVFQEKNARSELIQAENAIARAKEEFEGAESPTEKSQAIAAWRSAVDRLEQIPPATLSGRMARPKLAAAKRDFQAVAGSAASSLRSSNLIEAAKVFAMQAAVLSQSPPHPVSKWEQVVDLWENAVNRLQKISVDNPGYLEAQTKLAEYKTNLGIVRTRLESEKLSSKAISRAKSLIADWQSMQREAYRNPDYMVSRLEEIIKELESVQPGTTAYAESQELLQFAKEALKKLQ